MERKNLEAILSKAIEIEEKGYGFYTEKSREEKSEIIRKTFSFLTDKEVLHIKNIRNFYECYKQK